MNEYNSLFLKKIKSYLNEEEFDKFLDETKKAPSRSLRLNKITKEDIEDSFKIKLTKIPYEEKGYYLDNQEKYGNTVYHHLGGIYFQEPSAMAPVNMYNFKGNEKVLDLCASPGGKSSQILDRIPDGILVSNEINPKRAKVLFSNLERLGYKNAIITNNDVKTLSQKFKGFFDVILVDSPCSGEGMMRKDLDARLMWNEELVELCSNRDKEILDYVIPMLKENGILIYSTCTFSKEENEDIISYLENKNFITLKPNEVLLDHTKEGFIKNTLRFYPFISHGEGQFMALLQNKNSNLEEYKLTSKEKKDKDMDIVLKFVKDNLNGINLNIVKRGLRYYHLTSNVNLDGLIVLNYGIELGEVKNNRFIPFHHFFKACGDYFKNIIDLDIKDSRLPKYIRGEEITADALDGYGVIRVKGLILGGFKAKNNILKNHYPKGLRSMNVKEDHNDETW